MGILNVTPDSFSDGGHYFNETAALNHAAQMINEGVDILDIGGESSRPGAKPLSAEEEKARVLPIIQQIRQAFSDVIISIDTYKANVAKAAVDAGANIVNDISGFCMDSDMAKTVAVLDVPVIIMHMNGTPQTMQENPNYSNIVDEIKSYFHHQINLGKSAGIADDNFILDPGIGFGKSVDHNFKLIQQLEQFCELGYPVLMGPSRKSFIGTTLNVNVDERLEGTAAAVSACILNGADIVRVHDVKEMKQVVTMTNKIRTVA